MTSVADICHKILYWQQNVKRFNGDFLMLSAKFFPLQECIDSRPEMVEDKSVHHSHKKKRSRLCAREHKTKKHGKVQRACPLLRCSLQCRHLDLCKHFSQS